MRDLIETVLTYFICIALLVGIAYLARDVVSAQFSSSFASVDKVRGEVLQ